MFEQKSRFCAGFTINQNVKSLKPQNTNAGKVPRK